ncbi:MAG: YneF family protein [Bacillus subtilis]|nr:YneF family protein [Bacillus subtilis]
MPVWLQIVLPIFTLLGGGVAGFFIARAYFKNYLEKNPPINEPMVRAMMSQMGRTPSEKQVRQVMASMNVAKAESQAKPVKKVEVKKPEKKQPAKAE